MTVLRQEQIVMMDGDSRRWPLGPRRRPGPRVTEGGVALSLAAAGGGRHGPLGRPADGPG
jgi:hypothetical protein